MTEPSQVVDNPDANRFELTVDGHLAELTYRRAGGRLVLLHTEVPGELEGKGLGGVLVAAAVDQAVATGETVVPECNFARGWLERHPEVAGRVTIG